MFSKRLLTFTSGAVSGLIGKIAWDLIQQEYGDKTTTDPEVARIQTTLPYGTPQRFPEVAVYKNHILHYDQARKIPLWVAEHITKDHVKGDANRRHSKFKPDPVVPEMFTAQNSDYWKSGWSRGHMAPAGNNKHSQEAMDQSFYLTNVLPQDLNNNSDFWNRLEIYCRRLTDHYNHVRIISGPLMVAEADDNGNKYIHHQVIGDNEVAVPTHLYKVVMVEHKETEPAAAAAFVVPNKPIPRSERLVDYKVPLEYIERKSGFSFLPRLSDWKRVPDLCEVHGCELMNSEQFELYITSRKLASANTIHRLDKVWKELEEKNIKPDKYTIEVYNKRRSELSVSEKKAG